MNVHQLDQMKAAMKDLAVMSKAYYDELVDAGFSKEEAMTLTVNWSARITLDNNQ